MFIVARLEIDVNLSKRTPSSILQKTGALSYYSGVSISRKGTGSTFSRYSEELIMPSKGSEGFLKYSEGFLKYLFEVF